jgi:hypothetical protein
MLYPIEHETEGSVLVLWELEPGLPLEPYCRCDGGGGDERAVIDELAAGAPAGTVFSIDRSTADRWRVYAHEGSPRCNSARARA